MGKSSPQTPQPVDPTVAIGAQSQANEATARLQQSLNNVNTTGPYGSVTWSQDPSNPDRWSQNTTLSPAEQQTYDLSKQAQNRALEIANDQTGRVAGALGWQPDLTGYNSIQTGVPRNEISYSPNQPPEQYQQGIQRRDLQTQALQPPETFQESVGPTDFTADRNAVTDASFQQAMSRINPEYGRRRNEMESKLANQGIGLQSTAYGAAQDQFGRQENDAIQQAAWNAVGQGAAEQQALFGQKLAQGNFYNQAQQSNLNQDLALWQQQNASQAQDYGQQMGEAGLFNQAQQANDSNNLAYWNQGLQAQNQGFNQNLAAAQLTNQGRQQGLSEQAYMQNLPINQLSALLGLGQVSAPQGVQYTPTQVQGTDALGAYALNAQQQNSNYQGALGQQNALLGGLAGLGQAAIFASDLRLKRDIQRIGTRPDGLGVYLYRYVWGPMLHVGVMAQEVLRVKPHAVVTMPNGYMAVDYGAL